MCCFAEGVLRTQGMAPTMFMYIPLGVLFCAKALTRSKAALCREVRTY